MTTYAKYLKSDYPVGYPFRAREVKLLETAQNGISTFAQLKEAILAADANDLLVLAPVTITLTEQLVINKPLRFKGSSAEGDDGTVITGSATIGTSLISILLGSSYVSTTNELVFENIKFVQADDDLDVIDVNNTSLTETLKLRFLNCECNVFDASADGWALDVSHSTAADAIQVYIAGAGWHSWDAINFTVKNASDVLEIHRCKLTAAGKASAVVTSTDAVAGQVRLYNCQVPHEAGVSGGNAAQLLISIGNVSLTGTTYAAADTNDFTGSQTETII